MDTHDLSPGDRRELRALVKKQFQVLRGDVKRREAELKGEIEQALLRKYRQQDERIKQAQQQMERVANDARIAAQKVVDDLRADCPELEVQTGRRYGSPFEMSVDDANRSQEHRALIASIPQQIADAGTKLDQDELNLLRDLTIGALNTEQAQRFLSEIPTVGHLVPRARLQELHAGTLDGE